MTILIRSLLQDCYHNQPKDIIWQHEGSLPKRYITTVRMSELVHARPDMKQFSGLLSQIQHLDIIRQYYCHNQYWHMVIWIRSLQKCCHNQLLDSQHEGSPPSDIWMEWKFHCHNHNLHMAIRVRNLQDCCHIQPLAIIRQHEASQPSDTMIVTIRSL